MATSYIPSTDADFQVWLDNFSELITADPTAYGLSSADATALATLTTTYDNALAAATNGSTRGPSTVNAKDVARTNAQARARQLATIIQANPAVTEEQKTDLGITVRKTNKTPIPAPASSPLLAYIATTTGQQTLRYSDQMTPDSRSKPFGVVALQLSVWLTAIGTPPSGPANKVLIVTRNPFPVNFTNADLGKMATYVGRWQTAKGLTGPDSSSISAVVG